ncbi:MAG: hypothetical protein LBV33_03875, partial [Lachnospiraceae bacterium]|nr:hypothetical protein [Lachnospiraceae bacterium]
MDKNRKVAKCVTFVVALTVIILAAYYVVTSKRPQGTMDTLHKELIALSENIENTLVSATQTAKPSQMELVEEESTLVAEVEEEEPEPYFRDLNAEKMELLEESTLAQSADEIINEDYSPKLLLADEELRRYIQKIFLDICREPAKIDNYTDVFTAESIELFKEITWKYDAPKEFYDLSINYISGEYDDGQIYGDVVVDSKYAVWEMELEEGAEGKWAYAVNYA